MRHTGRAAGLAIALWVGAAGAEGPGLDLPAPGPGAARDNLVLALTQAQGSVDVVLSADPDLDRLERLLELLVLSTARQVRVSFTRDMPRRDAAVARVGAFVEGTGAGLHVCEGWWRSPETDPLAARVWSDMGGALVLIDNDPTTDFIDNPEADMEALMREDPAFAGVLGDDSRRIADAADYHDAVSAVWTHVVPGRALDPARQSRGGWVDGC